MFVSHKGTWKSYSNFFGVVMIAIQ